MKKILFNCSKKIEIEEYQLVDKVVNSRPIAIRDYDQIYMVSTDMLIQAKIVAEFLENRKVVFLGDGDGMSLLFLFLMEAKQNHLAKEIMVMDFDERIVNNYKSFFGKSSLKSRVCLNSCLYNVLNPVDAGVKGHFDFFYINPPYGSKNNGNSCIVWLYRCIQLCEEMTKGCIILPYDNKYDWSVKNMKNVQNFLINNGFVICDMLTNIHSYYLDDNPDLKSSMMIVEKKRNSQLLNDNLPEDIIWNLYGSKRPYPQYIRDNGQPLGEKDFMWRYGSEAY